MALAVGSSLRAEEPHLKGIAAGAMVAIAGNIRRVSKLAIDTPPQSS